MSKFYTALPPVAARENDPFREKILSFSGRLCRQLALNLHKEKQGISTLSWWPAGGAMGCLGAMYNFRPLPVCEESFPSS